MPRIINSFVLPTLCLLSTTVQGQTQTISSQFDKKVDMLLSQMTLEEKIGQMTQLHQYQKLQEKAIPDLKAGKIGSILNMFGAKNINEAQRIAVEKSRLHIPLLLGLDVIHGYQAIFPIPLAEDCAWNPDLTQMCARVSAQEASAAGIRWTFAPMVDICRDPRWGRIAEGSGEDPFLGSQMAIARIKGFQGADLSSSESIAACAKHYVGYGAAEAGRDYNTADMSETTLREVYLPPFEAAVKADVKTIMSAFNDLNGVPASGNNHTLREILKGEWGFKGFVVSDWDSLEQMVDHGFAVDKKDAALKGLEAGVDMDMDCDVYRDYLPAMAGKEIPVSLIDDSVRRILKLKYELGLFDNPYTDEAKESSAMLTAQALDLAWQEACQSIILLKNDKNLLPLSKGLKTVAVIGILADSKMDSLGPWHCRGEDALEKVKTILKGIQDKIGGRTKVFYCPGVAPNEENASAGLIDTAVDTARAAQVAIVVVGETQARSGEAASRAFLSLPGRQEEMLKAIQATGVPLVLVLMNGRPLTIQWEAENIPAIVETWYLGTQQGLAVADVLFGEVNPSGKLAVTFPRNVGQIPIYYDHMNTGRPIDDKVKYTSKYLDSPNTPLYPFGFGLSYTQFAYSNLRLSKNYLSNDGKADMIKVTADIKNTGKRSGSEVVQFYIRQRTANTTQPVKKLVGFKRLELNPGEIKKVEFVLNHRQLAFYDSQSGKYIEQNGNFYLWVARDSTDDSLQGSFKLVSGGQ